mmetsp:Transcript_96648/g.171895  ORF Transcript_96648/g.171895 Transcript_96648/m.171895 type:complete len:202 (+) Transcript_96648:218-823(+)
MSTHHLAIMHHLQVDIPHILAMDLAMDLLRHMGHHHLAMGIPHLQVTEHRLHMAMELLHLHIAMDLLRMPDTVILRLMAVELLHLLGTVILHLLVSVILHLLGMVIRLILVMVHHLQDMDHHLQDTGIRLTQATVIRTLDTARHLKAMELPQLLVTVLFLPEVAADPRHLDEGGKVEERARKKQRPKSNQSSLLQRRRLLC